MSQSLPEPSHVIADKYVVERSLGQGGMGAVYLVSHRVTGKKLALKCLLPQYLEHPELVARFTREAQAAGRIQHRHVVDVFDVGRDGSVLYIVMPYLEGEPLSALLRERALSLEDTLAVLLRAMEGVAAAHEQGIVHRDLKPDNIFVCVGPSGRLDDPRVLYFGISKLDDDQEARALTKSGVLMGTPHYMSFEQLNSQRDIDARADVYAMGCILYEALAGVLPYSAESAPALAIRMMSGPPKHLSALRPDLPSALVDAVMRAIEREREQRQPTMAALIAELRAATAELGGRQTHDGGVSPGLLDGLLARGHARFDGSLARPERAPGPRAGTGDTAPAAPAQVPPNGEDPTVAAPTPTDFPGRALEAHVSARLRSSAEARERSVEARERATHAETVITAAEPIDARRSQREQGVAPPRLRLEDEPERQRPSASGLDRRSQRWIALTAAAVACAVLVWGLTQAKPAHPATAQGAQAPAAPKPAAAGADAREPAAATGEPKAAAAAKAKRKVLRKVRRKKPRAGAAPRAEAPGAAGAADPPAAAPDEWEEYEEEIEVDDSDVGAAPPDVPAEEAAPRLPPAPTPADVTAPNPEPAPATATDVPSERKPDAPPASSSAAEPAPNTVEPPEPEPR
jgi:serine/threonine-protein kinase